jgi:hypothetical protein
LLNREVFHRRLAPGSAWDTSGAADFRVSNASGSSVRPSVLAQFGVVFITWRDERDGNREIYVRRGTHAASGAVPLSRGIDALRVAPNPMRGFARVLRASGRGDVLVHDARGRTVRRLTGEHELLWNGRDDSGRGVAAGVYFLRSVDDGLATRVTVLR